MQLTFSDRVHILIDYGWSSVRPRCVSRNVNKDRKGEFVKIDNEKIYLSDMPRDERGTYLFGKWQSNQDVGTVWGEK